MRPWLQSINDGTIDGEMARGQRALIYHGNSFSNTLILRAARETLGYDVTQEDHERLALLANMIGHALCDPHDLERKAGAVQEKVGDWFYRVPSISAPIYWTMSGLAAAISKPPYRAPHHWVAIRVTPRKS